MIIQNQKSIGYFLVRSCANRVFHNQGISWKRIGAAVAVSVCVLSIIGVLLTSNPLKAYLPWEDKVAKPVALTTNASVADETADEQRPAAIPKLAAQAKSSTPSPIATQSKIAAQSQAATQPNISAQSQIAAQSPATTQSQTASESSKPTSDEEQVPPAVAAKHQPEVQTDSAEKIAPMQTNQPKQIMTAEVQKSLSQSPATVSNAYSDLLGELTLQRNETLSRIIQIVYGNYNSKYFRSLILANPLIDDPDRVEVGQTISLPAIPAKVRPQPRPIWWVQVDEKDSLEAAFNFLRSYPDQAPPVRMIPYWTSEAGTRFVLVLKSIFSSKTAADMQLRELPPNLTLESKIVSLWSEDTVFFADPFLVSRKNR